MLLAQSQDSVSLKNVPLSTLTCSFGSHPLLWHPIVKITSECGGDPLGPLPIPLTLHKLVSSIDADDGFLLLQAWYFDDKVLAGSRPEVH